MPTILTNAAQDAAHDIAPQPNSGFLATTTILTADGALPVEWIITGDRIITHDCGMATLKSITQWRYHGPMVTVPKGALGPSLPTEDIQLIPEQLILLTNGQRSERPVLTYARDLVNDPNIYNDLATDGVDLRFFEFDTPHLVYAAGLATGTGEATAA